MVHRVLKILGSEITGLHQAAYLLGVFAVLSQILGLIRDRLLAHLFGASTSLDIYYAAFRIPDFIFVSVASFVSVFVLVPFLVDKVDRNKREGVDFISNIFSFFFVSVTILSVLAFFLTPRLSEFLFPNFDKESLKTLTDLTRILLLSPIFLGLSNLFSSITQVYKKFFVYSLSPLLYNLGIIVGILFFYPSFGLQGLGMAVALGAFLHLIIQLPTIIEHGFFPSLKLNLNLREIFDVVKISFPRTITLSLSNITILILIALAGVIGEGSISIFNFSFNLQSVPLSVIGVSYSVAAFPTLARFFSAGDRENFVKHIIIAARHIIFWSIPAIFLFIVLRAQIVRVILGSGNFTWEDTRLTAAALALFAISILAQSLVMLFVRGYYAAGLTKKPLLINIFSSIFIILISFLLVEVFNTNKMFKYFIESLFRIEDTNHTNIIMLPLAYSFGMILNCIMLWWSFKFDFKEFFFPIKEAFFHSIVASFFMAFITFKFLRVFDGVFDINTFWGILLQGLLSGIIGLIFWFAILKIFQNDEINEIWRSLHSRFWKNPAIGEETGSMQ
jgi:putative peptidoglycan lipid II flippase